MESKSHGEDVSSSTAVLLGALSSGVNGPTWNMLKVTFLMLGVCLAAMLFLAFSSSDFAVMIHVVVLVIITAMLFLLLNRHDCGYALNFARLRHCSIEIDSGLLFIVRDCEI